MMKEYTNNKDVHKEGAEAPFLNSEKQLRELAAYLGEGIFVLNDRGAVTLMNPEAVRLLGWTIKEMNERGVHELIHARKADGTPLPVAECSMHNVIKTGKRYVSRDEVFRRRDSADFPVSVISSPIFENGRVVGAVTAFNDITEQKEIEKEREFRISQLQAALEKVKTLNGLLPICSSCKKIRNDRGYWAGIEAFVSEHCGCEFSHGICPDCADAFYKKYGIKV